ncbi:MAG: TetR/AcrR family transcriptional regulator [Firmicutes bacterium]|nr:TetR/AcrR family transcriptional regulator [Bacillota bacterium]
MARNKNSESTKKEILDTATDLFIRDGYENTTIEDILKKWGGSKGSLYYYFKSKEEILDAVAHELVEKKEERILEILSKEKRSAMKSLGLFLDACHDRPQQLYGLEVFVYESKNITLFYRIAKLYIAKCIPILEPIILQGIEEGVFHVEHPSEVIELALTLEELVFKYPMFDCSREAYMKKIAAFQVMVELALGLEKGALNQLSVFMSTNSKNLKNI